LPETTNGPPDAFFADGVDRRQLVERKAAHAVVATGEEPHDRRQVIEVVHGCHAELIAEQQVPLVREAKDMLELHVEL